jgi:hypothetical protein
MEKNIGYVKIVLIQIIYLEINVGCVMNKEKIKFLFENMTLSQLLETLDILNDEIKDTKELMEKDGYCMICNSKINYYNNL